MGRAYEIETPEGLAVYPSVTTILDILDKPGLKFWSVNCALDNVKKQLSEGVKGDKINYQRAKDAHIKEMEKAQDIGTEVHNAIEQWVKSWLMAGENFNPIETGALIMETLEANYIPDDKDDKVSPANSFRAFLLWAKEHNFTPIASEFKVYSHKHRIAGTLDCLCMIDGDIYVIDFKTSKAHYDTAAFQISAYRKCLIEMISSKVVDLPRPKKIGVLRLDKETGLPDWKDYSKKKKGERGYKDHWLCFRKLLEFYYISAQRKTGHIIPVDESA